MDDTGAVELELHEKERHQPSDVGVVSWSHAFAAGCVSGMAAVVVGQPFDTVKVRMQTSSFPNPRTCVKALISSEGPAALFRGLSSPLLTASLINAIVFSTYNETSKFVGGSSSAGEQRRAPYAEVAFCGAVAGAVQCSVLCPTELIKCKVQTSNSPHVGPMHCLEEVWRCRGPVGLYAGLVPCLLRDIPAFATYFALYEVAKDRLETKLSPWASSFAAGGLAGVASWAIVYPIDVVKTVVQTSTARGQGALALCQSLLAQQGPGVFFRGMSVALLRALPVNAIVFPAYEGTVRVLSRMTMADEGAGLRAPTTVS